jgi:hypothetical protein
MTSINSINSIKTIGTRAQVWHGTSKQTSGGLTKLDLVKNKHGYIVSKKKSTDMKKNPNKNPLKNYLQEKNSGEFGAILDKNCECKKCNDKNYSKKNKKCCNKCKVNKNKSKKKENKGFIDKILDFF